MRGGYGRESNDRRGTTRACARDNETRPRGASRSEGRTRNPRKAQGRSQRQKPPASPFPPPPRRRRRRLPGLSPRAGFYRGYAKRQRGRAFNDVKRGDCVPSYRDKRAGTAVASARRRNCAELQLSKMRKRAGEPEERSYAPVDLDDARAARY